MTPRGSVKGRKRSLERPATAPVQSDQQLLFSNLQFYFFPNKRTNRARALRIDKTIQNGAILCQHLGPKVTHVIMDDGMRWEEFTKYHKELGEFPHHIIVVNGRYITDCMTYGLVLPHNQRLYQVLGHAVITNTAEQIKRAHSDSSLPVTTALPTEKDIRRSETDQTISRHVAYAHGTQEYSSAAELIGRTGSPAKKLPADYDRVDTNTMLDEHLYNDDLSIMINDTRATAHLPIDNEQRVGELDLPFIEESPSYGGRVVPLLTTHLPARKEYSTTAHGDENSLVMQKPSDGSWVKLRCKECGESNFQDIRAFLKHCAFLHKQRFKTQDQAIEECGFPLKSYSRPQSANLLPSLEVETLAQSAEPQKSTDTQENGTQEPPEKRAKLTWEGQFACMSKNDGTSREENPNAFVIEQLQEMADFYERTNDQWRSLSFRRGVSALKKQTKNITTKEEARKLLFVGDSIAEAIEKIAQTGKLNRLEATKDDPLNQVLQLFMGIYGVGLSQATKWVSAGFRTLDDLRMKTQLSANQKIGLEHYDELQQRIPRSEVEKHGDIFKSTLSGIDSSFQVTIGGSYRRGSPSSGDIDLIITKPGASLQQVRDIVLDQAVPKLFALGFLKAELARTSTDNGSKWHGCSAVDNGPWRRIDFLFVPWDEMGAALIYFTGNDIFNRSIRLLASKKGMRLNQKGLYKDVLTGKGREKLTDGELLESKSEKRIFDILGVPWRPPEHRNC